MGGNLPVKPMKGTTYIKQRIGHQSGYTLIEIMAAMTIMFIGVAAAAVLSLTMASQEEINHRVSRALHLQEGAARLFQLGLSPTEIDAILPNDPAIRNSTSTAPYTKISFAVSSISPTGFGTFEEAVCTMNFGAAPNSGTWTAGTWTGGNNADRTRVVTVVRPTIR